MQRIYAAGQRAAELVPEDVAVPTTLIPGLRRLLGEARDLLCVAADRLDAVLAQPSPAKIEVGWSRFPEVLVDPDDIRERLRAGCGVRRGTRIARVIHALAETVEPDGLLVVSLHEVARAAGVPRDRARGIVRMLVDCGVLLPVEESKNAPRLYVVPQ
ncbi:hypothetical protein GCM10012275_42550 [Longimycelium tulufanense]|uniref:Uncharacterized protein n=1 Tax=Longimycelium tulufanense TaxID=907463 RepID=A0A8J3CHC3_9PSEU|nr:hypothetical protein GCM10012275_42550 [Longimycelium tulufanense]